MICVGIDVAKDKHDCFILSSEGEVLADVFTIPNNAEGFDRLFQTIRSCTGPQDKIKVGLEATGHYSYNILGFLQTAEIPGYRRRVGAEGLTQPDRHSVLELGAAHFDYIGELLGLKLKGLTQPLELRQIGRAHV